MVPTSQTLRGKEGFDLGAIYVYDYYHVMFSIRFMDHKPPI